MGRPLKFQSVEVLEEQINAYFEDCERNGAAMTVTGLAWWLGIDRSTLVRYGERKEFCHTIKMAKVRIEASLEEALFDPNRRNIAGIIFCLKNNFGWKDKHEVEEKVTHDIGERMQRVLERKRARLRLERAGLSENALGELEASVVSQGLIKPKPAGDEQEGS